MKIPAEQMNNFGVNLGMLFLLLRYHLFREAFYDLLVQRDQLCASCNWEK